MDIARIIKHLLTPPWTLRRLLSASDLEELEAAVRESESRHRGEIRLAVEAALDPGSLWRGQTARQRALELFSDLRVWDTAENSGVLVYLLAADHQFEIVADRGVNERVNQAAWEAICRDMEAAFRGGKFKDGLRAGLAAITDLLAREYPATGSNPNELTDTPAIIR